MALVEIAWNPYDPTDPGPCIKVMVMNPKEVVEVGRENGLEFPAPVALTALLDTGASVSVISRTYAQHCKLFQTSEGSQITALGSTLTCGEHAGAISFPGTDLKPFDPMRIISADFVGQRHYACLIGRDILRNWHIRFDGAGKRVTIED